MTANDRTDQRLAVLIDADNTSPKKVREMLEELAGYGTLTVKRAYGDWTTQQLGGWKDHLLRHAISPMQQFANTRGKNSTDSAMVIDAMDLLYADNVDGFVIVSSDADFTRLATRIRESGKVVYGLGQRKTPTAFVEACDKFIYLEVIGSAAPAPVEVGEPVADGGADGGPDASREPDGALHSLVTRAINKSPQDDDDWTQLGTLGSLLNRTDPSFDPRAFGFARLSDLVRELPYLETKSVTNDAGRSELWVRLKGRRGGSGRGGRGERGDRGDRSERRRGERQEPTTPEPEPTPEPAPEPTPEPVPEAPVAPAAAEAAPPAEVAEEPAPAPAKKATRKRATKKSAAAAKPAEDEVPEPAAEPTPVAEDAPAKAPAKKATRKRAAKKAAPAPEPAVEAAEPAAEQATEQAASTTTATRSTRKRATRASGPATPRA